MSEPIRFPTEPIPTSVEDRKKELGTLIQSALKVGANLAAREAGRRAYAELVKLDKDLQTTPAVSVANSGQLVFATPKRRRERVAL
jgi:hypothetical protein